MKTKSLPPKLQAWLDVKKKYRLSQTHITMAMELGLNPKKFGKIANHQQEPWKAPLAKTLSACATNIFLQHHREMDR